MHAWQQLWLQHPVPWKLLVKKWVQKRAAVAEEELADAQQRPLRPLEAEFQCSQCVQTFSSFRAMATHRRYKHQHQAEYRAHAVDGLCRVCGTNFWTRQRLLVHLDRSAASMTRCHSVLPKISKRLSHLEQEALDKADRALAKSARAVGHSAFAALRPAARDSDAMSVASLGV